jgi:DNA-binding CsgD family transcriptional regulator
MNNFIDFILDKMPAGLIVYDENMRVIFTNKKAEVFFKRFKPPDEIKTITKKIIEAIRASKFKETVPGEIFLYKEIRGSSTNWIFRFYVREHPQPIVCVFISEESLSNMINVNEVRNHFRLTRREVDVLKHVLDDLKNSEIAEEIEMSEQMVKDHLSNIFKKLGVADRPALLTYLLNSPRYYHIQGRD